MAECEAGGVGISCPDGCGVICTRPERGKQRKCVAMCNPEVSIFKFGGAFTPRDRVIFCSHNLRPESLVLLFQNALPKHKVQLGTAKLQRVARHTGQMSEIGKTLGLGIQRRPARKK